MSTEGSPSSMHSPTAYRMGSRTTRSRREHSSAKSFMATFPTPLVSHNNLACRDQGDPSLISNPEKLSSAVLSEVSDDFAAVTSFVKAIPSLAPDTLSHLVKDGEDAVSWVGELFTNPHAAFTEVVNDATSVFGGVESEATSIWGDVTCFFGGCNSGSGVAATIKSSCSAILVAASASATTTSRLSTSTSRTTGGSTTPGHSTPKPGSSPTYYATPTRTSNSPTSYTTSTRTSSSQYTYSSSLTSISRYTYSASLTSSISSSGTSAPMLAVTVQDSGATGSGPGSTNSGSASTSGSSGSSKAAETVRLDLGFVLVVVMAVTSALFALL